MDDFWAKDSYRNIAILFGTVVLFVVLAFSTIISYNKIWDETIDKCNEEITDRRESIVEEINRYMTSNVHEIKQIAHLFERSVNINDKEEVITLIETFDLSDSFSDIGVLYPNSTTLSADGKIYDLRAEVDFAMISDKGGYFTGIIPGLESKAASVCIYEPVLAEGEVIAYIVGVMDLGIISKIYSKVGLNEQAGIYLIDTYTREVIMDLKGNRCVKLDEIFKDAEEDYENIEKCLNNVMESEGSELSVYSEKRKTNMYYQAEKLEFNNWYLVMEVDEKTALKEANNISAILVKLIMIFVSAFFVFECCIIYVINSNTNFKVEEERRNRITLDKSMKAVNNHMEIVSSLAKIYSSMYVIDLSDNYYEEITDHSADEEYDTEGVAADKFRSIIEDIVVTEDYEDIVSFFDIDSISDRLQGKTSISVEYAVEKLGWQRTSFIVKTTDDNGRVTHVLCVTQTIDEDKQKEIMSKQNLKNAMEEARRANAAKSDFLSRISHDIRTPINGIIGMIDMARNNFNDKKLVSECFGKMHNASNMLLSIINDVLNMSKLESDNFDIEEERVDIIKLLDECYESFLDSAKEREILFKRNDVGIKHPYIMSSPMHLRQIFVNIYRNAIKYTDSGGSVKVTNEEIGYDGDKVKYRFSVADNGIGMSTAFVERIFEPFSQEFYGARTTYTGTGLGLSIVKGIVDKMAGEITVSSKEGIGSIFTVTLTFDVAQYIEEEEEETFENKTLEGSHILLVEDNELNMEIARYMLEEKGVIVSTARDGDIAVEEFSKSEPGQYDLILMDIMMPVMDGITATKNIRRLAREDAKTIPIIALTANAFADDINQVKEAGMNAHIAKPIDANAFFDTILRLI